MSRSQAESEHCACQPLEGEWGGESSTTSVIQLKKKKGDSVLEMPFVLSEALPVIPAKLVKKVEKGEFVDMEDFLKVRWKGGGWLGETSVAITGQINRREVPDILSWLHSFCSYAAILSEKFPSKTKELWTYQALMISEARRCGSRGWLLYDASASFRQQISAYNKVDFSKINQSLYSTTFLAYGSRGQCCQSCMASDHVQEECALYQRKSTPGKQSMSEAGREARLRKWDNRRDRGSRVKLPCYVWNNGRCMHPQCPTPPPPPAVLSSSPTQAIFPSDFPSASHQPHQSTQL